MSLVNAGVAAPGLGDFTRFKESANCFEGCLASSFFVSFSTTLRALAPLAAIVD
jgi:hypothetical protein